MVLQSPMKSRISFFDYPGRKWTMYFQKGISKKLISVLKYSVIWKNGIAFGDSQES